MWFEVNVSFEVDDEDVEDEEETTSTCRMKLLLVGATSFAFSDDEE